jgi:hypothetical protein
MPNDNQKRTEPAVILSGVRQSLPRDGSGAGGGCGDGPPADRLLKCTGLARKGRSV